MKFLLIILLLGYLLYRLAPYFLRWFITYKAKQFSQNAQNRTNQRNPGQNGYSKNTNTQASANEEKVFTKDEGEYVNFEEIREDK